MPKDNYVQIKDGALKLFLKNLTPELEKGLVKETKIQADELTNYIIENHLTGGTTHDRLKVRSGSFRRLTIPIKPQVYSKKMKAGTLFAGVGARVHVGPKNQVTTIKPITSKYLAIPIGDALSASGAPRYSSPRAVPGLRPITSRKGNLLLVRTDGQTMTPMFLLLKETEIRARIHPEVIMRKRLRGIANDYEIMIEKALREAKK